MDLNYSKQDEEFRAMVKEWIAENLPERYRGAKDTGAVGDRVYGLDWYKVLAEKGWLCTAWPEEHGGPGWSLAQQTIFYTEASAQGAPGPDMGVYMVGPLLIEYGNDEQKKTHLPLIASAERLWCQGYSEPNAGSDLANLALRAEVDGDDYVLNGQKIWTSGAADADWIFILARTDASAAKKQIGISFLLSPMDAEGIRIEPIQQITDEAHFFETFFTDVRVPISNRVGAENEGWTIAKRLLAHERVGLGSADRFRNTLGKVLKLAKSKAVNGHTAAEDPAVRQSLAKLYMELDALSALDFRRLTQALLGNQPGPESSIIKLFGSELYQHMCDLALEIQGPLAQVWDDENMAEAGGAWGKTAVGSRAWSIFSGTSEVQRNIISERVLGMPR